jgi:exodeoxyribonuclease V alpha subunit
METLTGSVERITYYNPENGYSVLRLSPSSKLAAGINREGLVTVVGNLPKIAAGEYLTLQGKWVTHPKHGQQFQAQKCEESLPATAAGIRRYLGSGLIKGIGPHLAERIVSHFGAATLDVIEQNPERLREVTDIGPKRCLLIAEAWEEQKQMKEIMLFLHSHDISTNLAVKIYKHYGDDALSVVQNDPYRLAQDIYGVGFKTADRIAQDLGLPVDHPSRIEAGVLYALNQFTNEGNVYAVRQDLVNRAQKLLDVAPELILPALERLAERELIFQDRLPNPGQDHQTTPTSPTFSETLESHMIPAIYPTHLYYSELGVAQRLHKLVSTLPTRLSDLPPAFVTLDPALSDQQRSAIRSSLSHPVCVLTGGPGTGKTTAIKALIAALDSAGKTYALASPTGRAAKRLSQATGRPASTIHRLLGFSPRKGFKHNTENPLKIDMLVVDETSMLDLVLANSLLKAINPGTHLLLVGDVDQLPSVGAGDVLRDIIASDLAAVTRLSAIFRQAAHSHIITNAHRINQGQMPQFPSARAESGESSADFFLFPSESPEDAAEWVRDVVCNRIPNKFGFHPRDEIQVLAPMYRGPVGVNALNDILQASLNPPSPGKPEKKLFGQTFRTGDKLMQLQNNYDKDVYNGDIGNLVDIDPINQSLAMDYEGRQVTYDWSEADQLVLAYAVTVHKAQGSEYPAIVIPLVTQHYIMLQRNLFYTAVTRARQLCVLVGSRRAMGIAVRNDKIAQRFTALDWRIRQIEA